MRPDPTATANPRRAQLAAAPGVRSTPPETARPSGRDARVGAGAGPALRRTPRGEDLDVVVVGAGFGGLAAALRLSERGLRVACCETLNYPGGCAGTFRRDGHAFEAGATLSSGLGPDDLFGRWIARYDLPVELDWIDPIVDFRAPTGAVEVPRDRRALAARFAALPGAPADRVHAWFEHQARVADALWSFFQDPRNLPSPRPRDLLRQAASVPRLLPALRWTGRPLARVLERFDLLGFRPLVTYLDALCQITVQCGVREAEAPFALAAADYYHRGTAHVRGGLGALARGLVEAIEKAGGAVELANRVKRIERAGDGWLVTTRRGPRRCRAVVANVLPRALERLVDPSELRGGARLRSLARRVDGSWGACMLYLVARPPAGAADDAVHLQLIGDADAPLREGNHLFCSIGGAGEPGRAPDGLRTITVSTHVRMDALRAASDPATFVAGVQERMRALLRERAPEWAAGVVHELPASPRTFERFTGRPEGLVGGVPRRAGLRSYLDALASRDHGGLHLVGDSVFPGQSTLATSLGGWRAAERVADALGAPATGACRRAR